jgi:hypothetical protein
MALVPIYTAYMSLANYAPIVDWDSPVTYTRVQPNTGGLEGHPAPAYSETKNMRPLMAPFSAPVPSYYLNNGSQYGPYNSEFPANDISMFGLSGDWTLSRLIQAQMPLWKDNLSYANTMQAALEARMIEDTWLTKKACTTLGEYEAEIAIASTSLVSTAVAEDLIIQDDYTTTASGDPNFDLQATPCKMELQWKGKRSTYRTKRETTSVLAFYDDAPELEEVSRIPSGLTRIVPTQFSFFSGVINYAWPYADEAAPQYINYAGRSIYIFHVQPLLYETVTPEYILRNTAYLEDFTGISVTAGPTLVAGAIRLSSVVDGPWGNSQAMYPTNAVTYTTSYGGGPTDNRYTEKPTPWKYDDPEFVGYFPFTIHLWYEQALIKDYCLNPDDRFDGLVFHHKVKIATVTRAWQGLVYNDQVAQDSTPITLKSAKLEQVAWYDTETGQVTPSGNACSAMTPIISDNWLGPDVIGPVEIPGFDWGDYEWPSTSVTIPAGTFLLEDGSSAPIYPTFYGAYVYDLHLKKWGKYDGEYKRLLDYAAINTYLPSQQSFSRFGIFGGILTADGKIRIFDESPAVSQVTYGKIGYYRQGMTSLEEVRVHHREFKTGVIKIESSIEGKLVDGSFTQEANFVDSPMWTKTGGYAAKWHNITIMGQFDLTYLEFRGIITGKR